MPATAHLLLHLTAQQSQGQEFPEEETGMKRFVTFPPKRLPLWGLLKKALTLSRNAACFPALIQSQQGPHREAGDSSLAHIPSPPRA